MRTAENHLPGPNEPIDFDTGSLITQGLSPSTGKPVRYYNFDVQSTTPAPLDVIYREDDDKPVESQLDLIDTLPGEKGYNDFRQIWKVYPRTMSPTRSPMQQRCAMPATRWKRPVRCGTCRSSPTNRGRGRV